MKNPLVFNASSAVAIHKMLFICPTIFSFPFSISHAFASRGYDVYWFDDRPSKNAFVKGLIRINRRSVHLATNKYLDEIIAFGKKQKIDVIFVVDGQSFLECDIKKLRASFPFSRFVYSTLDSITNFPYSLKLAQLFDVSFSFDDQDVKKYPIFRFLPDFFTEEYSSIPNERIRFDYFYFGTAHPKKLLEIEKISKQLEGFGLHGFLYQYLPSKLVFFYNKGKSTAYKRKKVSDFCYVPLSTKDICAYYSCSSIIIDSPAAGQSGLTPRCISAVGAHKKLITTNPSILNYDFYRPENVYYAKDAEIDYSNVFFHSDYVQPSNDVVAKYSLDSWCDTIIKAIA
jgi:hypothetical protein